MLTSLPEHVAVPCGVRQPLPRAIPPTRAGSSLTSTALSQCNSAQTEAPADSAIPSRNRPRQHHNDTRTLATPPQVPHLVQVVQEHAGRAAVRQDVGVALGQVALRGAGQGRAGRAVMQGYAICRGVRGVDGNT